MKKTIDININPVYVLFAMALFFSHFTLENKIDALASNPNVEKAASTSAMDTKMKELMAEQQKDFSSRVQEEIKAYVAARNNKQRQDKFKPFDNAPVEVNGDEPVYGNENAKIALIEYSDYDCPFCSRFHNTPKNLVDKSDGNIRWHYRHYPLESIHPTAKTQAVAATCVAELGGNKEFWAFSDMLMSNKNAAGQISQFAQSVGVDPQALSNCMNDQKMKAVVDEHIAQGNQIGVTGTPATLIVNTETGKSILVSGAVSEQVILKQVQAVL